MATELQPSADADFDGAAPNSPVLDEKAGSKEPLISDFNPAADAPPDAASGAADNGNTNNEAQMEAARKAASVNGVALDLSFGDTPMEFQKVNFLGSRLQQAAIYSLVLSVNQITYLDVRGNNLDAAFGWRLIKSMKKKYLQLEYCNGIDLRGMKANEQKTLDLCSITGHNGIWGIEVVGAIFLAHFLRYSAILSGIISDIAITVIVCIDIADLGPNLAEIDLTK